MAYWHSGAVFTALALCIADMVFVWLSNHTNVITLVLTDLILGGQH